MFTNFQEYVNVMLEMKGTLEIIKCNFLILE